jgi:hypothetical protein
VDYVFGERTDPDVEVSYNRFIRKQWMTAAMDDVVTTVCHIVPRNKLSAENRSTVVKEQQ